MNVENIFYYPWLKKIYENIINQFKEKYYYHNIIFSHQRNNGELYVILAYIKFLLCKNPNDIFYCNKCSNCYLMYVKNHPDFYDFNIIKKISNKSDIELLRNIINSIYCTPKKSKYKIIFIYDINLFSNQFVNLLLKILESFLQNVFFIFGSSELHKLPKNFISRNLVFKIIRPVEKYSINWISKKINIPLKQIISALRLSNLFPINALNLLSSLNWKKRLQLCNVFKKSLVQKNFTLLLFFLKGDDCMLFWKMILSLFSDAIKFYYDKNILYISNVDQIFLIQSIIKYWSILKLHEIFYQGVICNKKCYCIKGINKELLLSQQIFNL